MIDVCNRICGVGLSSFPFFKRPEYSNNGSSFIPQYATPSNSRRQVTDSSFTSSCRTNTSSKPSSSSVATVTQRSTTRDELRSLLSNIGYYSGNYSTLQNSTSSFSEYYRATATLEEQVAAKIAADHAVFDRVDEIKPLPDNFLDDDEENPHSQLISLRKASIVQEERDHAEEIINGIRSHTVIVIDKFNIDMTMYKIGCLRPRTWLNDEVVNFYMAMLQERDERLSKANPNRTTSHYFNSFFMTKLQEGNGYSYAGVKRWSKKFDLLSKDKIFVPININNTHWTLAVVYIQKKEIHYYDSMSGSGRKYLQPLLNWVRDDAKDKKNVDIDTTQWKLLDRMDYVPQQENGYDCGMFVITCADYLSDDLPLSYDQEDIGSNRVTFAAAIIRGSISY